MGKKAKIDVPFKFGLATALTQIGVHIEVIKMQKRRKFGFSH